MMILWKKELLEAWREKKLIWLPVVLSILTVSQPLSIYYMEDLIKIGGNLPDGALIKMPTPTSVEVLSGTLSQLNTIGTVIIVLAVMNSISYERNNGILALIMAKPIQAYQYIASKWIANNFIVIGSFIISYLFAYYYTNLLFGKIEGTYFVTSLLLYCLWIIWVITILLFWGTLFKKSTAVAGVSILFLLGMSFISTLLPKYTFWLPSNIQQTASNYLLLGNGGDHVTSVIFIGLTLIMIFFYLTIHQFKRLERY